MSPGSSGSAPRYTASPFCLKVMACYREMFGGQGRNVKKTDLPRRVMQPLQKKKGKAAFERRRAAQQKALSVDVGADDVAQLEAVANLSAREPWLLWGLPGFLQALPMISD